MGERALRGSRLGSASYESDEGVDIVPRQQVSYLCPNEHRFTVPFSVEAEVPQVWECRLCGAEAVLADGDDPEPKAVKPPRTHWDMLMERREITDLEDLLNERLTMLRASDPTTAPAEPAKKSAKTTKKSSSKSAEVTTSAPKKKTTKKSE